MMNKALAIESQTAAETTRTVQEKIHEILEPATENSLSRKFDIFIISLIILNVIEVMLQSVEGLYHSFRFYFDAFQVFSVWVFTVEYLLRLWTCTVNPRFRNPVKGRLRYVFTPMAMIDLMAVVPFYLPFFFDMDLRFLRVARLFRLFTLFKMARYSQSLRLIGNVVSEKKEELLVSFALTMTLLVLASGVIYFLEHDVQPGAFSSIPAAMWWGVATMTTVGYGDIYPITAGGRLFGGLVAILGLGTFGLPAGIIAYGFLEEIQKRRYRPVACPHCGKEMELPVERRHSSPPNP